MAHAPSHTTSPALGAVSEQASERTQSNSIEPSQLGAESQAPSLSAADAASVAHPGTPDADRSPDRSRAAAGVDAASPTSQPTPLLDIAPVAQSPGTPSVASTLGASASNAATSADGPAGPAAQAAPVLLSLASRGGASEVSLLLTPGELGQMHVRIARDQAGGAAVTVTVEKPETLTLLVGDQAALHRALDKAGVSAQDRSLTFHLATADKDAAASASTPDMNGDTAGRRPGAAQDWAQSYGESGSRSASSDLGQQRREPARAEADWTGGTARGEPSVLPGAPSQPARAGVNITA